ncbi:MAG: DHH family phosphoesterase [Oscillospiraceae bacterium]|nr:DHH family phosphoesterase [Oscillospiraceae bacterium]
MNLNLSQAAEFFRQNDNFTLLCHANPDGDTLGSGYALCGALHMLGKRAKVLCADKASTRFDYLKEALVPALTDVDESSGKIITVDVADLELLGDLKEQYTDIDLCVDHHVSNKFFAKATLLDTAAAACAELVWDLIKELMGGEVAQVGAEIRTAVYTGVSTDTGCFRFSNTTAKSHAIAAELMDFENMVKRVAQINYIMFEMKTLGRIELEQKAYSGIEYHFDNKCAVIVLTRDMLADIDTADTANVSVLPKQVEGVQVGILLKERDSSEDANKWKISVRTNMNIDAQEICSVLGGGGHVRAAGCKLKGSVEEVKTRVLAEVEKQL